jgi:hypothetical protein
MTPWQDLPYTDEDTPLGRLRIVTRGGASAYERKPDRPIPRATFGAMTIGAVECAGCAERDGFIASLMAQLEEVSA